MSITLSLVLVADAYRDTIYQGATNGQSVTIARRNLREQALGFLTQLCFFVVAVSFVSTTVPSPLPTGTTERVGLFTLGASIILAQSIDGYLTKRRLLAG